MKRLILTASSLCLVLLCTVVVRAEDGGARPLRPNEIRTTIMERRNEIRDDRQEMMASRESEMKEMRQDMKEKMGSLAGEIKEKRAENMADRCTAVTGRIARVISNAQMGIGGRVKAYNAIAERLTKVSSNLAAKGANVTALNAAIATLKTKIATLQTDYTTFTTKLSATKDFECGKSQGDFKTALTEASTSFQQVRKDQEDIQTFLKTDVKTALMALKETKLSGTPEVTVAPTAEAPVNQ